MKTQPYFVTVGLIVLACLRVSGWGEPHAAITKAGLETLPTEQKAFLGAEYARLVSTYCIIPDLVHKDKTLVPFATMYSSPGVVYHANLHLPAQQPENFEILRYFMGKAVAALRDGDISQAAKFTGTLCHAIEDWSCPAHAAPGDNMFTLFQQFLPPPDSMKNKLLHGPIEANKLNVVISDHKPQLLGTTIDEAAFRLLHRVNDGTVLARAQIIPIIQGIYAGDTNAVKEAQMKSATAGAGLVADAVYTIIALGTQNGEASNQAVLATADISPFYPLEAIDLFFAQAKFLSSPYWGHSHHGYVLAGGTNAIPLKLRVNDSGAVTSKEFASGISTGSGANSSLTYLVPQNVFKRFIVLAGLHPELGAKGGVEFSVSGNGKLLANTCVTGDQPAHRFTCDLAGVTNLQLLVTATKGSDPKSNYAIWAEPRLLK
ncbi:MAG: NPCBM/NEW2 domain-containing protein [bacterium]